MTTNDRYSFWIDRRVGEFIYRFHNGEIRRCLAADKARHFHPWGGSANPKKIITQWRSLCDQSAAEKNLKN